MKNLAPVHRLLHKVLLPTLLASAVAAGAVATACSSSSTGGLQSTADSGISTQSDGGSTSSEAGACANPTVSIVFSPMYSAYIPGSTAQVFSVPAVTADGNTASWSLSDPSQAQLQPQSFTNGTSTVPGVMITLAGTGDSSGHVTVYATESNGACGAAVLNITTNTED